MSIERINQIRRRALANPSYTYLRKAKFYKALNRHLKRKGYTGEIV
jgi:hypothetical protein